MPKKVKKIELDAFHYHEALDRTYVAADMINRNLTEHPVVKRHKELRKRMGIVEKNLYEIYQLIGTLESVLFKEKNDEN